MGTNITGIGNANAIGFKSRVTGGIYFPPELKDALVGVWSAYGKSNDSTDRNIIKNKIKDRGGDFVISNAAFKLNSGFGGFVEDFTSWDRIDSSTAEISNDGSKIKCINTTLNVQYLFNSINRDIPSFKVKISNFTKGDITYYYRKEDGIEAFFKITPLSVVNSDKVIELPKSYNTVENGTGSRGGFYSSNINIGVTIEQIPSFEGAFVTDGVNDLITSTKTVQEMGVTDEITIVSMIHQIQLNPSSSITNDIRVSSNNTSGSNGRIVVSAKNKTGIYGWSRKGNTKVIITKILGDKNDYSLAGENSTNYNNKFSVVGTVDNRYNSSVAWYWTIIANKVLTSDQINQVIAYFNLDRTLNPDILCNVKKQGITNENHAEFGDKLIDYSGNGRDIQLNNIAWKRDSGIGKYAADFTSWSTPKKVQKTSDTVKITTEYTEYWVAYLPAPNNTFKSMKVLISGIPDGGALQFYRTTADGGGIKMVNGINEIPEFTNTVSAGFYIDVPLGFDWSNLVIKQIPSHAGALCLDGVNDFGKVTGMPIYKDYTFIIDREIISIGNTAGIVASKSEDSTDVNKQGAFLFEYLDAPNNISAWSFYRNNGKVANTDFTRGISYQSKYSYNGIELLAGTALDSDKLWLGILRDKDSRFANVAIYSLMSFPYSMSEFLIERQLKKHKLGTLYPDMVEFRPVIKSNASYHNVVFYYKNEKVENGTYLTVGSSIGMHIRLSSNPVNEIKSITVNGIPATFKYHDANNNIYQYDFNLTSKSPQKINITIDEYIRFEDIVQPYPVLLRFNDENGNEVSWGGKFKVGSNITRIGSIADPERNLLNGLYSISGLSLNGKAVTSSTSIVEKQMVFTCTATYLFDNNEPKCILSPSRLRIPNSSYKLLGYIPDISGHGNNGVINNSAYAEGSGVNEDGSYQLDGVDDFVTIPTLSSGGKQVLMKVNWNTINSIIYDQRGSGGFAIYCSDYNNPSDSITVPAYKGRNAAGTTYIDGIRNEYIIASQLRNVTHNIVEILDTSYAAGKTNPIIGKSHMNSNYGSLALYDFMLFDEISTDNKIKELNEYVGIEAKVELPPYYWDAYGKTNLDADKATIQQRGVAVGDYDLTNTNFAYDKMSGYGGYSFSPFSNTNDWRLSSSDNTMELLSIDGYSFTARRLEGSTWWKYKNKVTTNVSKNLTIKIRTNNSVRINWELKYKTAEMPDADSTLGLISTLLTPNVVNDIILPVKTQEELDSLGAISHFYIIYFPPIDVRIGDEYTVEMLPLYPNGLVYDAITDYSENVNIPVFTDFTAIMKRKWLKNQGCPLIKGSKVYEGGNGNALLFEWDKAYNFVFYKRTDIMEREVPENISFITPTNYNGNVITRGSGQDTNGICIAGDGNAGFANIVFYKLILYPKTIPLLQINFLKNLMERDEIIDLNNPIFIQE